MNFSSLLKDAAPWTIAEKTMNAPFQKRTDQPWMQATARNFGHAAFGEDIGNAVDQKILRDTPGGYRGIEPLGATGAPLANTPQMQQMQQPQQQSAESDPFVLFAKLLAQTKGKQQ